MRHVRALPGGVAGGIVMILIISFIAFIAATLPYGAIVGTIYRPTNVPAMPPIDLETRPEDHTVGAGEHGTVFVKKTWRLSPVQVAPGQDACPCSGNHPARCARHGQTGLPVPPGRPLGSSLPGESAQHGLWPEPGVCRFAGCQRREGGGELGYVSAISAGTP